MVLYFVIFGYRNKEMEENKKNIGLYSKNVVYSLIFSYLYL